jgi:hypothetical protein
MIPPLTLLEMFAGYRRRADGGLNWLVLFPSWRERRANPPIPKLNTVAAEK